MNIPRTSLWGLGLAVIAALISGLSVYLNGLMVRTFPDPTLLAGVRNGLVGLALVAALAVAARRRHSPATPARTALTGRQRAGLLTLGVIGGGLAFALFFQGLALAASPASAVLQRTLFLWVALAAWPLLGERPGRATFTALGALLAGTLLLDPPTGLGLGLGESLIIAATLLWTAETIIARRLLPEVGAGRGAAARMAIGSVVLLALVAVGGGIAGIGAWTAEQWLFVAGTAALLAVYVTCWYGALERAPATLVTSVLALAALITAGLRALAAGALPAEPRLAGLALVGIGVVLAAFAAARGRRTPTTEPVHA